MEEISRHPLLIIAAHPDDETIAAGALIRRSDSVRIVHATDGAPIEMAEAIAAGFDSREEYAQKRMEEVKQALSLVGVPPGSITTLSYVEQQLAFHLGKLTQKIADQIRAFRPAAVLTHAYEGGHPDHDSVAFSTRMAVEIVRSEDPEARLKLYEYPLYHGRAGRRTCGEFIPAYGAKEMRTVLTDEERALKRVMLRCFDTQRKTLEPFFDLREEAFRRAPSYDFTRPPHSGRLYYESFNWGIDGQTWRALAMQTLATLQPERAVS